MLLTRQSPNVGKAYTSSVRSHWFWCLPFFQPFLCSAWTCAAASRNVGMPAALRRCATGSRPASTCARAAAALVRASESVTLLAAPKPISRRLPSFWTRTIHDPLPPVPTARIRPSPSLCRPGLLSAALTPVAVSFVMISPLSSPHRNVAGGERQWTGADLSGGHALLRVRPFGRWRTQEIEGMAERVGFEPTVPVRARRISSAVLSTTQPPLRRGSTRHQPRPGVEAGH